MWDESSCEDINYNNPETGDKSGYDRINDTQLTYCDMMAISACFIGDADVDGGWNRIVNMTSLQLPEMTVPVDGIKPFTMVLASAGLLVLPGILALLSTSPVME